MNDKTIKILIMKRSFALNELISLNLDGEKVGHIKEKRQTTLCFRQLGSSHVHVSLLVSTQCKLNSHSTVEKTWEKTELSVLLISIFGMK
jgi:hypothetical protein